MDRALAVLKEPSTDAGTRRRLAPNLGQRRTCQVPDAGLIVIALPAGQGACGRYYSDRLQTHLA